MSQQISTRKLIGKPGDPESLSLSLAHIVVKREGEDVILGQAWLAAKDTLVTCGHVVEEFKRNPAEVTVKFPLSGNRYVVREIKLHPTYGKKGAEQLIRFDVAKLTVDLRSQDAEAPVLPITYDKYVQIPNQQSLSAIRYPSHLGQLTTSQFPLAQVGRYLGLLKKADRFHLLHDLALAPGDSGSPIFDGDSVIALHCGDTATLPGLNLPTTSIRLALSIDALRALDIAETKPQNESSVVFALGPGLLAFLVTTLISFLAVTVLTIGPMLSQWSLSKDNIGSIQVRFNKADNAYKVGDFVSIAIKPENNCFLRVFYTEEDQALILFPPPGTGLSPEVKASHLNVVDGYGSYKLRVADRAGGNLHMFVLKKDEPLVTKKEYEKIDPDKCVLPFSAGELSKRMNQIQKEQKESIHEVFDAPQANNLAELAKSQKPSKAKKSDSSKSQESVDVVQESSESSGTSNNEDTLDDVSNRHGDVVDAVIDSKMEKEAEAILRANKSQQDEKGNQENSSSKSEGSELEDSSSN